MVVVILCKYIPIKILDHFKCKQIEMFKTSFICQWVHSKLGIYSQDTGRWVLPYGFSLQFKEAIIVPGIVQDDTLHERFPCWS